MDDRRSVLVALPPAMKRKLVARAKRDGCNMNDLVVGVLAARFHVEWEPSGRNGSPGCESVRVVLRMPALLKRAIQIEALDRETDMSEVIVSVLATWLRVRVPARRSVRTTPFGGGPGRHRRQVART
jgi:hypothetical protein